MPKQELDKRSYNQALKDVIASLEDIIEDTDNEEEITLGGNGINSCEAALTLHGVIIEIEKMKIVQSI